MTSLQCWAYGISGFRFWRSRITAAVAVAAAAVVVGMLRTMRRNKQRKGVSEDF